MSLEERNKMKKVKSWCILVIALLFLIFVAQNTQVVSVKFLFWQADASRVFVLIGAFFIGLVAGSLLTWPSKKNNWTAKNDK
jgi:uncharacterized integral membrane protein